MNPAERLADRIIREHINETFTALQFLAFRNRDILIERSVGSIYINGPGISHETPFDLASLTKPLCTTLLVIKAISEGKLSLESRLGELMKSTRGHDLEAVPLFKLLNHTSGLVPWRPWGEEMIRVQGSKIAGSSEAKTAIFNKLLKESLKHPPAYSDLGFILLGFLLEHLYVRPLDELCKRFYDSVGLKNIRFIRLKRGTPLENASLKDPPATRSNPLRGRIQGVVDDDNAFVLGGVAGHAGLFAPARDVHRIIVLLLESYKGDGPVDQGIIRRFWDYSNRQGTSFVYGFDTPSGETTQAGKGVPSDAIGHLGFTGTSFWVSPYTGLGSILLTNRVFFPNTQERIRELRRKLHGLIWEYFYTDLREDLGVKR